jgi:ketosteroid isomerase-like protein
MPKTPTVEALRLLWIDVFNSRDVETHALLYTEDAMLFGSNPELVTGRDGIKAYFAGQGPGVHVHHYPEPYKVLVTPDIVATAAHVDFADGDELMPYRMTWLLVKQGDNWRIAQHHGSPRGKAV